MIRAMFITLTGAILLAGCRDKEPKEEAAETGPTRVEVTSESGQITEVELMDEFVARLRSAVVNRDMNQMAALMTPNFGFHLNPAREGDGVFQFWDENELWGEVEWVVNQEFVPFGKFWVAPAAFADQGELYKGFRTGIYEKNGRWYWAYLVGD